RDRALPGRARGCAAGPRGGAGVPPRADARPARTRVVPGRARPPRKAQGLVSPGAPSAARVALHQFLARHQRFLLTTHVNPDGDAIGSEVAFARWLRATGKSVHILNDSPTPRAFEWLAAEGPVEVFSEELAETRFSEADALVVIDTGNRQRIGRL